MCFVVAFRAQAYAAYSKKLLNPFKITSSARLTTAEILNDQKKTLISDLKIDLLSYYLLSIIALLYYPEPYASNSEFQ